MIGPTVLVVDDEPDIADTYAAHLSGEYEVRTAYSGAGAMECLDDDDVAVTLLDRRLPDSPNGELLGRINQHYPGCRITLVTGVTPGFDIVDMEFDDYVVKPVTGDELRHTVERMLTRSDYRELLREYFTLISKSAALQAHKTDTELESSPEFARLEARIEEMRSKLDALVATFDSEDFRLLCRDLS